MRILFFSILFATSFFTFSQSSNEYAGLLKLNDTTAITYRVVFKESNGMLSGYSITDFGGEHETKSNIKGTYDDKSNELSFYETGIVYTKSTFISNDFCFVHLEPIKFKLGKTKSFKGKFLGKFSDGVKCIDGEVFLNAIERIEKLVTKVTKKLNNSKKVSDSIKREFNNLKIMDSINLNVLKRNQTTSVFTKSNKVNLIIYDGGKIDNDIITVLKDGKIILLKHKITEKKEILEIELTSNKTTITIIADSVGSIGTNTAVVEFKDDVNDIKTLTNLNKGEKTIIDILKR
ncbi:MAG: hypothetical protein AB8B52_05265 [Winogradskyella sp.]|uniref:hypothetical protein n=1 Tax=Winogradskyella sp. TaxID=1883156 RepID=UPI00385AA892